MNADDPRHGTNAGYIAGCREECCRVANWRYSKRLKVEHARGQRRTTETWRAVRRLDSLACLGWSRSMIAKELGIKHKCQLYAIGEHPRISLALFAKIDAAFERLSMTLPPSDTPAQRVAATKARNNAKRRGAVPPLAWDDIDDPAEQPILREKATGDVDEVLVQRVLSGNVCQVSAHANMAERIEIRRRWIAAGRTVNDLARLTGWKPERYAREDVA